MCLRCLRRAGIRIGETTDETIEIYITERDGSRKMFKVQRTEGTRTEGTDDVARKMLQVGVSWPRWRQPRRRRRRRRRRWR